MEGSGSVKKKKTEENARFDRVRNWKPGFRKRFGTDPNTDAKKKLKFFS
jgi:hypothetical protein